MRSNLEAKQRAKDYGCTCRLKNMLPKLKERLSKAEADSSTAGREAKETPFSWVQNGCSCRRPGCESPGKAAAATAENPEELFQQLMEEAALAEEAAPEEEEQKVAEEEDPRPQWPELEVENDNRKLLGNFVMRDVAPSQSSGRKPRSHARSRAGAAASKKVKADDVDEEKRDAAHDEEEASGDGITLMVKMPNDKTVTLRDIRPDCTVEELPVLLRCVERESGARAKLSPSPNHGGHLQLVYSSKHLQPKRKIDSYHIQDGATLFALLPLLGGAAYLGPEFRPELHERPLKKWPELTKEERITVDRLCKVKGAPPEKTTRPAVADRHFGQSNSGAAAKPMGLKEWVLSGCREGRAFTYQWNHVEGAQYCKAFDDSDRWKLLKPGSKLSATRTVHAYSVPPKQPSIRLVVPPRLPEPNPGPGSSALLSMPPDPKTLEEVKWIARDPNREWVDKNYTGGKTANEPNGKELRFTELMDGVKEARELLDVYRGLMEKLLPLFGAAKSKHGAYSSIYERNAREIYKVGEDQTVEDVYERFNSKRDRVRGKWMTYLADKRRCEAFGRTFPPESERVATMLESMDKVDARFETMGEEADEAFEAFDDARTKFDVEKKEATDTLAQIKEALEPMRAAKASERSSGR